MTIHLSRQREQVILSLLQTGMFVSADDVIDEALRLVEQRYQKSLEISDAFAGGELPDRARQQRENLRRLAQKLDTMPLADIEDGLSNRDHDRILYGQ